MAAIQRTEITNNVTHLEFTQAMTDFKIMFPEVDEDVIEVVLRSNNGAVDPTIDHLLTMSVDSENEKIRKELDVTDSNDEIPPRYSPSTPPPTYQQAVPQMASPLKYLNSRTLDLKKTNFISEKNLNTNPPTVANANNVIINNNNNVNAATSNSLFSSQKNSYTSRSITSNNNNHCNNNNNCNPSRYKSKWQPPLVGILPANFLRLDIEEKIDYLPSMNYENRNVSVLSSALLQQKMEENERQRKLSQSGIGPDLLRYLEDERFAILLQNEEFVQELQRNKDFMSTLELDSNNQNRTLSAGDAVEINSSLHSDSDAFKEKLRNMSKVSRRKFAQLAKLFSRRKRPNFLGGAHSESGNPSRDNLLNFDDSYTEFENEDASDTEQRQNQSIWNNHHLNDENTHQIQSRNVKT